MPTTSLRRLVVTASLLSICGTVGFGFQPAQAVGAHPDGATLASTVTPFAGAPNPTPGQLSAAHTLVQARLRQVAAAEKHLVSAKAARSLAETKAEIASEHYDGAHVKLVTAQQAVAADRRSLVAASRTLRRSQAVAAKFAVATYESGGLQTVTAIGEGGPSLVVQRLGSEQAVAVSQEQALQKLKAAQIVANSLTVQAQQANAAAAAAAKTAQKAFNVAKADAIRAQRSYHDVDEQQHRLSTLLEQAKAHSQALQREHIEAVARAAAAAARRAAAARAAAAAAAQAAREPVATTGPSGSSYTHDTGNLGGTVSAATEERVVAIAEGEEGKPYVWAAAGPDSFDCSGLTMWSYAHVGVQLEHYTGDQWNEGAHIATADLRPGDLVFFATDTADPATIHHVGIYIGNGMMVDAPYTGADVQVDPATSRPDYIGAVRPYRT